MSEKGQVRKSMFSVQNMEELRRLYESDTPVLAYDFNSGLWGPNHLASAWLTALQRKAHFSPRWITTEVAHLDVIRKREHRIQEPP